MPVPPCDKPLGRLMFGRIAESAVRQGTATVWLAWVGLIVTALLLTSCERREIVRPTPQMDVESRFWMRVLLIRKARECSIAAAGPMYLSRSADLGAPVGGPASTALTSPTKVTLANGQFVFNTVGQPGPHITISPGPPHVFALNNQKYRGKLALTVNPDGKTFSAVNLVPLEPYLAGVVGAEMPDYWEIEALKAQTIAARTYCLYTKQRFGANRAWDVSNTQTSQVYRGINAESARVWKAVTSTHGMVLVSGSDQTTETGLFPAYYSAICGGHTEDCKSVFGETFGPLKPVPCPYCKDVARLGLFFWPMAQFDQATVTKQLLSRYPSLEALDQIESLVVAEESHHGAITRLTRIRLVGTTGKTDNLRGEDLRLALDPTGRKIQSTVCQIVPWGDGWAFLSGRGWGHGVGMCQHGAQGMARQGRKAEEILQHYYPGSAIKSVY